MIQDSVRVQPLISIITLCTSPLFSMPPPAVNNGMLSELLQTGKFSDCTITCQGKEFKLHKVVVCAQSPVIAAALEKTSKVCHR